MAEKRNDTLLLTERFTDAVGFARRVHQVKAFQEAGGGRLTDELGRVVSQLEAAIHRR